MRTPSQAMAALCGLLAVACDCSSSSTPESEVAGAARSESERPSAQAARSAAQPDRSMPNALLLAYAQFEVDEQGKTLPKPGAARLEILRFDDARWRVEALEDPDSNVFHKAFAYPESEPRGIVTLGGSGAFVKLWQRGADGFDGTTLWHAEFGGKFDRMRDAEFADVYGDGRATIVVGTHDQGVVTALRPEGEEGFEAVQLSERADTFIHEIEIGDLDGDGTLEVYATPSEPNKLDGGEQHGEVVRYIPARSKGPEVVADLGDRHAKEIYVGDADGDGRDELYVAVEALTSGEGDSIRIVEPVEIRRYDHDTKPDEGRVVARLRDRLCRFLTVGDVEGDGRKEMVAAAYRSGVWLLRPPADGEGDWKVTNIDRDSSGFEHAALLTDLDSDGADELYVAADEQGEVRRYVWEDSEMKREVIHKRPIPSSMMTWNIMPVPVSLLGSVGTSGAP